MNGENKKDNETNKKFSDFVRDKRQRMGLSQKELSEIVFRKENQQGYISSLEKYQKNATASTMDAILTALNSSIEFVEL